MTGPTEILAQNLQDCKG